MAKAPTTVSVEARRLDISILPPNFSLPLTDFLVNQSDDLANVAGQANTAANGAYLANLTNEEQDVVLSEHTEQILDLGNRVSSAESTLADHDTRITDNTSRIAAAESDISTMQGDVSAIDSRLTSVEGDYVSKSETSLQSLASPLNVATSYSIGGVKVVGPRQAGWTAAGGNVAANIGAWNPNTLAPASATYSQTEATAVRQQLNAAEARVKAMESALRNHGLIS